MIDYVGQSPGQSKDPAKEAKNHWRVVRAFLRLLVAAALLAPLVWISVGLTGNRGTGHAAPTGVEVYDEAGVLNQDLLSRETNAMEFARPSRVVYLTLAEVPTGNFNEAVLAFARSNPQLGLIDGANPDKWASGTLVFAVAPKQREVAIYLGEDRDPGESVGKDTIDAMRAEFKGKNWDAGMLAGARAIAPHAGAFHVSGSALFFSVIGALIGLGEIWVFVSNPRKIARAKRDFELHMGNVDRDRATTEAALVSIPPGSQYGAIVEQRFAHYKNEIARLSESGPDVDVRGALRFSVPARNDAKALASAAEEMDLSDDAIVSASDFFSMRGDWEGAWANEIGPVMEDLNSLEELVDTVTDEIKTAEARASRDGIMRWIKTQTDAIMAMRGQLRDGTTTPDEALAALDAISEQTRSCAVDVINASLDADTSEYAWKRRLRWQKAQTQPPEDDMAEPDGAYKLNGEFIDYDPSRTIRPNFSVPGVADLELAGFGQAEGIGSVPVFVPLSMMNGRYYDEHSWTPPSSSSSSSSSSTSVGSGSYGSSGGSFSGSGYSGSF